MPSASLKIRVRAHSDALHRVLCVCHRRTLEIAALNYTGETIELAVAGAERHLDRIDRWLSALPDVLGVQLHPPDPTYSPQRGRTRGGTSRTADEDEQWSRSLTAQ
jgi:acetolactate synthase regulatory subunit